VRLIKPDAPAWVASRELAICGSSLLVLPLALQKDLSALRFVAPISILALLYMAFIVTIKAPLLYKEHLDNLDVYGNVIFATPSLDTCEAFALCVFAFNCHLNVVPVAGSMLRPTKARILKVSARVNALQLGFYALIGVSGYLSFLEQTPQDIILGYNATDLAVAVGRLLLTFTIFVAIPTNLNPTIRSGMALVAHWKHVPPATSPRVAPQAAPPFGAMEPFPFTLEEAEEEPAVMMARPLAQEREDGMPPLRLEQAPAAQYEPSATFRSAFTTVLVVMQAGLAVIVPGVADVLSILGATVATAMMLTIPAYAMGIVLNRTPKRRAMQVVLYLFSIVSAASVPVKLLRAAGLLPKSA